MLSKRKTPFQGTPVLPTPPPHPATVAQPKKAAFHGPAARPPHPATVVQPRAPHPATAARPGPITSGAAPRPPHPARGGPPAGLVQRAQVSTVERVAAIRMIYKKSYNGEITEEYGRPMRLCGAVYTVQAFDGGGTQLAGADYRIKEVIIPREQTGLFRALNSDAQATPIPLTEKDIAIDFHGLNSGGLGGDNVKVVKKSEEDAPSSPDGTSENYQYFVQEISGEEHLITRSGFVIHQVVENGVMSVTKRPCAFLTDLGVVQTGLIDERGPHLCRL